MTTQGAGEQQHRRRVVLEPWTRRGRNLTRLVVVWLVISVAVLVAAQLPAFRLRSWPDALLVGAGLGVLNALVWPLLVRLLLRLTVLTLGLGAFVLYGGLVLVLLHQLPGVQVLDDGSTVAVAVALAALTAFVTGLLDIDHDEFFQRAVARRVLRRAGTSSEVPGVVFLQIDGLGHDVLQRAVRDGNAPTVAAWLASGSHRLVPWETDWSSQTGASQCALLHGSNADIPAFRWYEKDSGRVLACNHPRDAAEIERRHTDGRGLLHADGASRGNLFTGDATDNIMTMSVVGRRRRGPLRTGYYGYLASPANASRTLFATVADLTRELYASTSQKRRGVLPRVPRGGVYPLVRAFTTVISRDVLIDVLIDDLTSGRSVVYADFLGYDEVAHHSGVERYDSLAVLRGIDRQIGRLARAAQLAPRPYRFVLLSDHGQSQGTPFSEKYSVSLENLVRTACGLPACRHGGSESTAPGGEAWQHRDSERARAETAAARQGLLVLASGNLGMVYLTGEVGRCTREQIDAAHPHLLPVLLGHPGIGFVLVRTAAAGPVVLGRSGSRELLTGRVVGEDPLEPYGPLAARRVLRADGFAHTADIVINAVYDQQTDEVTAFESLLGSHGGMGGEQSRPYLLYPTDLPAPPAELFGAEAVHQVFRQWLAHLGHAAFDSRGRDPEPTAAPTLPWSRPPTPTRP